MPSNNKPASPISLRTESVAILDVFDCDEIWEIAVKSPYASKKDSRSYTFHVPTAYVWFKDNAETMAEKTICNCLIYAFHHQCEYLMVKNRQSA